MDTPLRKDTETPLKGVRQNIVQSIRAFRVQELQDAATHLTSSLFSQEQETRSFQVPACGSIKTDNACAGVMICTVCTEPRHSRSASPLMSQRAPPFNAV